MYCSSRPLFSYGGVVTSPHKVTFRGSNLRKQTSLFRATISWARVGLAHGLAVQLPPDQRFRLLAPFVHPCPQEGGKVAVEVGQTSSPGVCGHSAFLIC